MFSRMRGIIRFGPTGRADGIEVFVHEHQTANLDLDRLGQLYSATSLLMSSSDCSTDFSRYSVAWYTSTFGWWISPISWPIDFLAIRPSISKMANSIVASGIPSAKPSYLKLKLINQCLFQQQVQFSRVFADEERLKHCGRRSGRALYTLCATDMPSAPSLERTRHRNLFL